MKRHRCTASTTACQPPSSTATKARVRRRRRRVQDRLLAWYLECGRKLPWREVRDPYAILVSEFMLQQTQVSRVVPKFQEFLARFPSLAQLAAAPTAEVIRAWSGLGYNRRAVRLHQLARSVAERHSGRLPDSLEELNRLEGVGTYTAAAIACFAFDQQVVVIDTNIRRVLQRLHADRSDGQPHNPRELAKLATGLLPMGRAADWNQGLMDLGATVCTARAPRCDACPIGDLCPSRGNLERPRHIATTAVRESRSSYRATDRYDGSNRYYRGRIVDQLRRLEADQRISLGSLGRSIRFDFEEAHLPWLLGLVRDLAADGLARIQPDAGSSTSSSALEVSLP